VECFACGRSPVSFLRLAVCPGRACLACPGRVRAWLSGGAAQRLGPLTETDGPPLPKYNQICGLLPDEQRKQYTLTTLPKIPSSQHHLRTYQLRRTDPQKYNLPVAHKTGISEASSGLLGVCAQHTVIYKTLPPMTRYSHGASINQPLFVYNGCCAQTPN